MTENRKHGWTFWTVAAMIPAVLYVASIGPAFRLVTRTGMADQKEYEAFSLIYAPIHWLAMSSKPLEKALTRYVEQWEKW